MSQYNVCVCIANLFERRRMDYVELVKNEADATDIQRFLVDGDVTAITVRVPKNLRDAAKSAASLKGMGFSAFIRMCLIEELCEIAKAEK